jgi:hypothetical protein
VHDVVDEGSLAEQTTEELLVGLVNQFDRKLIHQEDQVYLHVALRPDLILLIPRVPTPKTRLFLHLQLFLTARLPHGGQEGRVHLPVLPV